MHRQRDRNMNRQANKQADKKLLTLITFFFLNLNQFHTEKEKQRDDKERNKLERLLSERKGWICIFSSWVNMSVGDQQVWFAK